MRRGIYMWFPSISMAKHMNPVFADSTGRYILSISTSELGPIRGITHGGDHIGDGVGDGVTPIGILGGHMGHIHITRTALTTHTVRDGGHITLEDTWSFHHVQLFISHVPQPTEEASTAARQVRGQVMAAMLQSVAAQRKVTMQPQTEEEHSLETQRDITISTTTGRRPAFPAIIFTDQEGHPAIRHHVPRVAAHTQLFPDVPARQASLPAQLKVLLQQPITAIPTETTTRSTHQEVQATQVAADIPEVEVTLAAVDSPAAMLEVTEVTAVEDADNSFSIQIRQS